MSSTNPNSVPDKTVINSTVINASPLEKTVETTAETDVHKAKKVTGEGKTKIILKGSLSAMLYRAINILYANDAHRYADYSLESGQSRSSKIYAYCVVSSDITSKDTRNFTLIGQAAKAENRKVFLLIMRNKDKPDSSYASVLRSIADTTNVPVFESLDALMEEVKKPLIWVGTGAGIVQQALNAEVTPSASGTVLNFTVDAKTISAKDVADFAMVAGSGSNKVTLTITGEDLRVDNTDADKQLTFVLQDGTPLGRLSIAQENEEAPEQALEEKPNSPHLQAIKEIAEEFGIEVVESGESAQEEVVTLECLEDVAETQNVQIVAEFKSGSVIHLVTTPKGPKLFYMKDNDNPLTDDVGVIELIAKAREDENTPITAIIRNVVPTCEDFRTFFKEFTALGNARVFSLVSDTDVSKIAISNESHRTNWKVAIPSLKQIVL